MICKTDRYINGLIKVFADYSYKKGQRRMGISRSGGSRCISMSGGGGNQVHVSTAAKDKGPDPQMGLLGAMPGTDDKPFLYAQPWLRVQDLAPPGLSSWHRGARAGLCTLLNHLHTFEVEA